MVIAQEGGGDLIKFGTFDLGGNPQMQVPELLSSNGRTPKISTVANQFVIGYTDDMTAERCSDSAMLPVESRAGISPMLRVSELRGLMGVEDQSPCCMGSPMIPYHGFLQDR